MYSRAAENKTDGSPEQQEMYCLAAGMELVRGRHR